MKKKQKLNVQNNVTKKKKKNIESYLIRAGPQAQTGYEKFAANRN